MSRIWPLALLCLLPLPILAQDAADLVKQAEAAYHAKNFQQSASLYIRALPLVSDLDRPSTEYNLACAQALDGDRPAALATLEHAIDDGYTDRKNAEANQDLISLHPNPGWQPLLERMTLSTAQQEARWGDEAFVTPNVPNLPDTDKLAGLSELWAQARYGFANFWHVPQLNWNQSYRDFIPLVLATHSTAEYYRVLQRFYALLQDGHSGVSSPDQLAGKLDRLPLRTRLVDGHLLLVGSRNPSADLQGLHPGDEILTINGEPAIPWAQHHVEPFVSASTPQDRDARTYEYLLFLAPLGTTFTLGTQTPSGQPATHVFQVMENKSPHPLFDLRVLPGNIAYVALNGFDDDSVADQWDKHWQEISQARSVILDLRENGGGSDSVAARILATLIDKPAPGELSRSTRWIASYRAWGAAQTPLRFPIDALDPDPARHYAGPVVLLTSPRTYSAGEDVVVVYIQAHRGKVIGEPTGGSSGQPLQFKLPGGGTARICTKHDSFADGREFVGIGIQPDIAARLTRSDILTGRDPALAAAIRELQPGK